MKYDVVSLPLAWFSRRVHQWWILAVDAGCLAVGVGAIVKRIQHLNFELPHQEDTAVSTALAIAFNFTWRCPFYVQLHIAKGLLREDVTTSSHRLHHAVDDLPLGRFTFAIAPSIKIAAVEQNDRVRRRGRW